MELKNSKTTSLGGNRYALNGFIGAVQMSEDGQKWQDIKPRLVRDVGGWHVVGTPYYAEIKDDGTRLYCPDCNERSKYFKLPAIPLLTSLEKNVSFSPTKLDGEVIPNKVVMPIRDYASIVITFTNTSMNFEVLFKKAPPRQFTDRFTFNADIAGLDIKELLASRQGVGIPRPRLIDNMALITSGYWMPRYWASGYWANDYWVEYLLFTERDKRFSVRGMWRGKRRRGR